MAKKIKASELVKFAYSIIGTPYVYGMRGKKMTEDDYNRLKKQYGDLVWDSDKKKVGKVCCDCSGLFEWAGSVSMSSSGWYDSANVREPISKAKDMPIGTVLWHKGHVGIISKIEGNEVFYIACDGSAYGCREANIKQAKFTHCLLVEKYFEYDTKEDEEVVVQGMIEVDDKEYTISMIYKDDYSYISTRELAKILGYDISNKGQVPILKKKK